MAEPAPHRVLADLGRLVLDFRLIALFLSILWLPSGGSIDAWGLVTVLVALAASFVPLIAWNRIAPFLMRHPGVLAVDLCLTLVILLFTGTEGPFLSYTLGTAFLAGLLYGWVGAGLFSGLLVGGYLGVLYLRAPVAGIADSFETWVGVPSRYVLFAVGAAAVRDLVIRQRRAEAELHQAVRAAAGDAERARLAREMHDTLGKSLHGIALAAAALARWVRADPARAERQAQSLAVSAATAAAEARELIGDLRSDRLEQPLHEALRGFIAEWSAQTGIPVEADLDPGVVMEVEARYELFCVVKEALRNVERHAQAGRVRVRLQRDDGDIVLAVADDGRGLPGPVDLEALGAGGHYGLLGIRERAARLGGALEVVPGVPRGVELRVVVAGARRPAEVRS